MEIEKNVIGRWPSIEPINLDLLEVVFYYQMEMEKSQLRIRKKNSQFLVELDELRRFFVGILAIHSWVTWLISGFLI